MNYRLTTCPVILTVILTSLGCGRADHKHGGAPSAAPSRSAAGGYYQIDLFKTEPRAGTAVVILVDTSGSMKQPVKDRNGQMQPKNVIANEAMTHIIQSTAAWKKSHPAANLQLALYHFNSSVAEVLPMGEFDAGKAAAAIKKLPPPNSGTAIGKALESAFKALYRSGCQRKFVVCITDGENTTGPPPAWIAHQLFDRTQGEVELQFVAFDTAADQFKFLKDVNGHVVEASDGIKLQTELEKIYQERILVEKEEPEVKK